MRNKKRKISFIIFLSIAVLFSFSIIVYLILDIYSEKKEMKSNILKKIEQTQQDRKEEETAITTEGTTQATTGVTTEATTQATTKVTTEVTTEVMTQATTEITTEATTKSTIKNKTEETSTISYDINKPNWQVYNDSEYNFSIEYPGNFVPYNSYNAEQRYTAQAPDGTADFKVFSIEKTGSPQEDLDAILESKGGYSDFSTAEDDFYIVSILEDGMCYYRYAQYGVGKGVTGFEMYYVEDMHEYDDYVEHIEDTIRSMGN